MGGSLGHAGGDLIARLIATADRERVPVVGLVASGGARLQEGSSALDAYGRIFRAQALATVPQISLICGTCAGGGAYSPALGDLVITLANSLLFLTGPRVLLQAMGEDVEAGKLGGARIHARNGVAHLSVGELADAAQLVREILAYLPTTPGSRPDRLWPQEPEHGDPGAVVPGHARQVYDVRRLLAHLFDGGQMLELCPRWAKNLVVGLVRLDGWPLGVIANQPRHLGGVLDVHACEKGSWFVEFCDRFRLPLAVIVDTPGFLPGTEQEGIGIIRRGAGLVRAFARATVPRATVTVRAAYGGAQIAMNSRGLGATLTAAWPTAKIGVMGGRQAVQVIDRRRIAAGEDVDALAADYESHNLDPESACRAGAIDRIVEPQSTREVLIVALTRPQESCHLMTSEREPVNS
jgi:acetyl-CoA carboxylase carboxyltransferase component